MAAPESAAKTTLDGFGWVLFVLLLGLISFGLCWAVGVPWGRFTFVADGVVLVAMFLVVGIFYGF